MEWVRLSVNKPGAIRGSKDVGVAVLRTRADLVASDRSSAMTCACTSRPAATSSRRRISRAPAREIAHSWPDAIFSRAYRNKAVGFDGPDFINLVLGFHARRSRSMRCSRGCAPSRRMCGRPRNSRRSGRRAPWISTCCCSATRVEKTADYTLPRPDLLKRPYMLGPMAEIAPGRGAPDGRQDHRPSCGRSSIATRMR